MRINSIKFSNPYNYLKQISKSSIVNQKQCSTSSLQCFANQNIAFCVKKPIYAMDKERNLQYFDSVQRAAKTLGVNENSIAKVLSGQNHMAGEYTFALVSSMEAIDKDGNKTLNLQAVQKLEENFDNAKTVPVYLIDYDGNIERFDSETQAANFLGLSLKIVNKAVNNYSYTARDYIVVLASAIELKGKDGKSILDDNLEPVLDYKKVQSELRKFSCAQEVPICTISYLGEITRYKNRKELIESKKYKENTISTCLNSQKPSGEVIFVYENDILKRSKTGKTSKDENGHYEYNLDEINKRLQVFEDSKAKPIVVKNVRTREVTYFPNASKAGEILGISKQMVSKCLKGGYPFQGYFFEYLYPALFSEYQIVEYSSK